MADINLKCPQCGIIVGVSQYADRSALKCHGCGTSLADVGVTAASADGGDAAKLRLKPQTQPAEGADYAVAREPEQWRYDRQMAENRARRRLRITGHVVSWLLFVLLGAAMWFLRYGGGLNEPQLATLKQWGPYVVLGLHVVILLRAFKDAIFQGILCLLVPCYSLFYLFIVSDYFFMRAAVAGLLVGIGLDSARFYQEVATHTIEAVNAWIASGGG